MRTQPQLSPGVAACRRTNIEPLARELAGAYPAGVMIRGQCGSYLRGYDNRNRNVGKPLFICHADQQSVITEIAERVRLTNERLEIYLLRNRLHEHRLARCLRR